MRQIAAALLALVVCLRVGGQTITASLEGTVTDATGARIPGAKVLVTNTATGITTTAQTAADGRFVAVALPAGTYSVAVEAAGFKRAERQGIVLEVNQQASITMALEVGTLSETVQITAQAPLLESTTAAVGQVIDNRSIVNLPLNQRNPYALVFLAPGVTGNVNAEFNQSNISVNGGRPGSNEILVDGIPSSPPLVNPIQGFTVYPSVDAVQEFKVQTDSYSAEFGRSGGGIINLVYKSGTNDLHGSVFEFLRNSKLDANNFFSNKNGIPLGSFKRNQFGASAGGPVEIPKLYRGRNKTFFFADYEGLRQRSLATLTNTVPTALERTGDFSQERNAKGDPVTIYDPATTTPAGTGFVRQPFAGNVIPPSHIDPVARNVMKYYPLPTVPGAPNSGAQNLVTSGTAIYTANQFDVKVDENINDRNRFFARYSHRKLDFPAPNLLPGSLAPYDNALNQPQIVNNAGFDYTYNLTPTFLLDFRYGFGRSLLLFTAHSDGFDPVSLGFPSYIDSNSDRLMFPGIVPTNYLSLGGQGSSYRHNAFETHNWSLNNSKVLTGHLLKFGFEARMVRVNNTEAGNSVGNFNFGQNFTQGPNPNVASNTAGDAIASLLLGLGGGTYTKCFKCVSTQSTYWAGYFADDWKVSRKLTLNAGIRYEAETPRTERYNRINVFDPNVASPLAGPSGLAGLRGGLVFAGVDGHSRRQFPTDTNNFAPRLGFAYQVTPNTVLRGGAGIFYAPSLRAAGGSVGNFGWRSDTTFVGSADGVTPLDYLHDPFPDGFVPVVGSSQGLLTGIGSSIAASIIGDSVTPYTENWSFNVQRQLPGEMLVEIGYVGSHGVHLNSTGEGDVNINQLSAAQLALGQAALQQQVKNPFYGIITSAPLNAPTIPYSFLLRPFPQFTTVFDMYQTGGISDYHSLQMKLEKRFSSGLSLLVSYTDAKLIDDYSIISNLGRNAGPQNIYNRRADRAVSSNDISQRFVASYVYAFPLGRGKLLGGNWNRGLDAVLGGWQMNGILSFETGMPLVITAPNTSNSGNGTLRPNNNGHSAALSGSVESRLNHYFDSSVFSLPAPFSFGNTGRTLPDVRGPGKRTLDLSLFKNFKLVERVSLQFRAEAFNLVNTPNFGFPGQGLNSPTLGVITAQANGPRQLQFAAKVLF